MPELAEHILPDNCKLQMVFQFELMGIDSSDQKLEVPFQPQEWELIEFKEVVNCWKIYLRFRKSGNVDLVSISKQIYTQDHDQVRCILRFGTDSPQWQATWAKMLAMLQIAQMVTHTPTCQMMDDWAHYKNQLKIRKVCGPSSAVVQLTSSKMHIRVNFKNGRVYFLAFVSFCGVVLFGYDTGVAGGVIAQDAFKQHFLVDEKGNIDADRVANVSGNVVSVLQAGAFFGALGSAPISSRFGRRRALIGFAFVFVIGAILQTIAGIGGRGLAYIYGGRIVAGVGIGGISAISPAFVSECSPKDSRGRFTGLFQIMVVIGVMISYFVNFGISQHNITGPRVWQIPFGIQLVPAGTMTVGLFFVKESPRWLASRGRMLEALDSLAYLRKESLSSDSVRHEMAEIEAAIEEEREVRQGLGIKEAFLGKGNVSRFVIAFFVFFFQQWTGQNSVNYYAPQMFEAIGYQGATESLLASGIYGIIKVITTVVFVFFFVERLGRRTYFAISAFGCGILFYIIGAILKTHPPPTTRSVGSAPPAASKAMAALLYIFIVFYSIGWGPLPWVYCSEIFPTRTRHYGLALASASQWIWSFVVSRITPNLIASLGWKIFIVFASIDIGAMLAFAMLIPETKGKSLEEMDIIFGAVSQDERDAKIKVTQRMLDHDIQELEVGPDEDVEKSG